MKLAWIVIPVACACGAAPLTGCSVAVEPTPPGVPPVGLGTLTVRWLVAGSSDPLECARYSLEEVEVVVYDASGRPVTRETAPCGSFGVTIPLEEGTYTADVTLLDRRGRRASTAKTIEAIEIVTGTDLAINLDFPEGSLR